MYRQCLLRLMHKTGGRSRSVSFVVPFAGAPVPSLALAPAFFVFFFFFFLLAEGASWVSASIGSASGLRAGQVGEVDREVWVDGGVGSMPTLGSSVQSARDTTDDADEGAMVVRWTPAKMEDASVECECGM